MTQEFFDKMVALLDTFRSDTANGALIICHDKETGRVKSISPLLKAENVQDIYIRMSEIKHIIEVYLEDLVEQSKRLSN